MPGYATGNKWYIWDILYYDTSNVTELQGILSRDKTWISPEVALYHESRKGKTIIVTKIYTKREGAILRASPPNSSEKTLKKPMNSSLCLIVGLSPRRVIIFRPIRIMNVPTAKPSSPTLSFANKKYWQVPQRGFISAGETSSLVNIMCWSSWEPWNTSRAGSTLSTSGQLERDVQEQSALCLWAHFSTTLVPGQVSQTAGMLQ